jgi:hypothetical protein
MFKPPRREQRRLNVLRQATYPTLRPSVTAFSNTGLISAPACHSAGWRHKERPAARHPASKGVLGRLPEKEDGGRNRMPLTKDFRETIRERAQREPRFRKALLREAIELMLSGDEKTGRAILRNYINATIGFRQLQDVTAIPANSLMRMFGPNGNPSAKNLFGVLAHLQAQEGVNFEVRARRS